MTAAKFEFVIQEDVELGFQLELVTEQSMELVSQIDYYPPAALVPSFYIKWVPDGGPSSTQTHWLAASQIIR
ncbi:hypothetical protein Tdes44962_MAKER03305 [Teratosphaeria destructans]|uniref:Uncharacterized protein n=1 Tax=Teratosphaeria destructans TaxID=418781 RepID=A0A9W7W1G0_9PEZI|nr:hypothetical protein Tdes44962_MAKER03305 [Teratosphaeria destructans]